MAQPPSVICPVDFSDGSRTALQYAAAVADHFGARLTVVSVDDPLLAAVTAASGYEPPLAEATEAELRRFVESTLAGDSAGPKTVDVHVSVGKPAAEILRVARERTADLVVMSSQGRTGANRRFFGSTTEAVLRATSVPVLVTPRTHPKVAGLTEAAAAIRRIVAPVDLSESSRRQLTIAAGLAVSLGAAVLVPYVIEPIFIPSAIRRVTVGIDAERRASAESRLVQLVDAMPIRARMETLILTGDPSEEIVKLADARGAGLIVMGLHSSSLLGPRMGSVTYRVLCMSNALVLAIPPAAEPRAGAAATAVLASADR